MDVWRRRRGHLPNLDLELFAGDPPSADFIGRFNGGKRHALEPLSPDVEIVPGVFFGRPEWVPSPAFWLSLASGEWSDGDRYVSPSGSPLADDVAFCILGGYGVKMEVNQAAWGRLKSAGALDGQVDAETIEALLLEPLDVERRRVRYRFPKQRAARLAEALEILDDLEVHELSPLG